MKKSGYAPLGEMDDPETAAFQVRVKAPNEEEIPIDVAQGGSCTVLAFKGLLEEQADFPLKSQRLVFGGRVLKNDDTLEKSGIQHGTFVHLFPLPENFVVNEGSTRTEEQATSDSDHLSEEVEPTESVGGGFPRIGELFLWRARLRLMCLVGSFYFVMSLADEVPYCLGFKDVVSPGAKVRYEVYAKWSGSMVVFIMLLHCLGLYASFLGLIATKTLRLIDAARFLVGCSAFIFAGVVETLISTSMLWMSGASRYPNPSDPGGGERDTKMELVLDTILRFCLAVIILSSARIFCALIRSLELHNAPQEDVPGGDSQA